jgi:hypothetical protein
VKRTAALLRVTALGVALGLIATGGLAVYYFTLPPNSGGNSNAANGGQLSSPGTISLVTNQGSGAQLMTVVFNGTSYQVPVKGPYSPSFSCPVGTDPALCSLLRQTCGNGVGASQEPWKTCTNCIFDAGCTGDLSCDPYTHQCSTPASACMVAVYGKG